MKKSKISQPAYHSKDCFMDYNLNVVLFLYVKGFKTYSGLNGKPFYFWSRRIAEKNKLLNFKRKQSKMYKSKI